MPDSRPTHRPSGATLIVIPLALAFGLPSALAGFIVAALLGSFALGLATTAALSVAVGWRLAREWDAPHGLTAAAVLLAPLSGALFFLWGLSSYET